jgi:NitT/TauT family transport system permease protein
MCASRWQILTRLRIPSASRISSADFIASGLSLIGAVVADLVAGTGGPGRRSATIPPPACSSTS